MRINPHQEENALSLKWPRLNDENGNVLLLGLGVSLLSIVVIFALMQVAVVYQHNRALANIADTVSLVYSDAVAQQKYFDSLDPAVKGHVPLQQSPEQVAQQFFEKMVLEESKRSYALSIDSSGDSAVITVKRKLKSSIAVTIGENKLFNFELIGSSTAQNFEN